MCFGVVKVLVAKVLAVITNKSSRSKSSDGDPPSALQPARVQLSLERSPRVAVPAHVRQRSRKQTSNIPLSILVSGIPIDAPANTYKDPNPWPQEMVVEYDKYKAADASAGHASTRYWQLREQREAEVNALSWDSGRQTYAPMNLTPESHFELRPMAVDWKDKAGNHHQLRKEFDDTHPTAYDSPEHKEGHQERVRIAIKSARNAKLKVKEHELYQGNFMLTDPYDNYDLATGGSSSQPNGLRGKVWNYDA